MNLRVACLAPPGDPVRDIAVAYMGSPDSGFSIIYWSSRSEVQIQSEYSVRTHDYLLSKESGLWKVTGPQLHNSASGEVMYICGDRPQKWNMSRWLRWVASCPFGAFVFESGWTQWGDITGPLSPLERKLIMQGTRHSRPGPSYWKTAFLAFFPPWAQDAYWDPIDTQRTCRIVASAIKKAIQVHLDKPIGGVRPLTMLEE